MNRLRNSSDAHYSQDSLTSTTEGEFSTDTLPQLPTTDDFRTSLILPDLSRRFSLLRSSTSDPAAFDYHLRSRLADQRTRGAVNQISEEEEDMLLNALGRIRIRYNAVEKSQENSNRTATTVDASSGDYGSDENGVNGPFGATLNSSPSSRSGKRYSNSLFAPGRLRDYSYLKSLNSPKSSASSTRTVSLTPTEMTVRKMSTSSILPPERTTPTTFVQPSPNLVAETNAGEDVSHPDNTFEEATSEVEYQLQNQLGPINLKRASMALQQVMKEIEDELEEEILLPRTTLVPRGNLDQDVRNSQSSRDSVFEGGMAISNDETAHDNASDRGTSPIPTRTMPGYVPGMPRPMTPRIIDVDEQRSLSTTPRAQSPTVVDSVSALGKVPNNTSKVRRDSASSITRPLAVAPLFLQRSTNGRFTPTLPSTVTADEYQRDGAEYDNALSPSIFNRRRPASPLAGLSYQPLVSNRPNSRTNSRPSTPSNVVWTPNSSINGHNRRPHSRSSSLTTDTDLDYQGPLGILIKPGGPRALRSPPLPDLVSSESEQFSTLTIGSNGKDQPASVSNRPHAITGDIDIANTTSPPSSPPPRALTPTQNAQRSPTSPGFTNKSPRQPPSSPFNISAFSGLSFSARANSSRSSLDSLGSSFHSWDEPEKIFSVFSDSKESQSLWHDFDLDKSRSVTPGDESDAEDVLKRYGGMKKADIAAIQDKLVNAAFMKLANTDPRDRAPSALRRRRPSTSQSNYTRIASPPPHIQPPASPTHAADDDHYSKASALLNSVVESIKDQPSTLNVPPIARVPSSSSDEKELSPTTRRNRALARVLFGEDDSKEGGDLPISKAEPTSSIPEPELIVSTSSTDTTRIPSISTTINPATTTPYLNSSSPPISAQSSTSQAVETTFLHRNPSVAKVPQTPSEEADLVREVQKKADAAMIALNKTSSSSVNPPEGLSYSTSIRRRVDRKDISMPKLVSTTHNLEAVPLTKLNDNSTSKLSSRFRRLRGSLRVKNVASSGEETITPTSLGTSSPTPAVSSNTSKSSESNAKPPNTVGSEQSRFKIPLQSPVTSGPGLKGFMARFRNKQRMSETPARERPVAPPTLATAPVTTIPVSPRSVDTIVPAIPVSPSERSLNTAPRSPGQNRPMYSRFPPASQIVTQPPMSIPQSPKCQESQPPESPNTEQSRAALQLLFSAANDLGLDQNALTDLLSRSGSVTSRNLLNRSNSVAQSAPTETAPSSAEPVSKVSSTGSDQTTTPTNSSHPPSQQELKVDGSPTPDDATLQKIRKPNLLRRPKDGQTENNPVVRITRVFANDAPELATLMNRKSPNRRKRVSTASVSSRSVHDRVPTPPPPKAAKRFSADRMPPVPLLPNGLGQGGPPVAASASITNHLPSTYDSLYDMYSGDSRAASTTAADDGQVPQETQPALEVIELANGETVWNVVNGLRDCDEGSVYSRASFVSEYSTREAGSDVSQSLGKGPSGPDTKRSLSPLLSSNKKGQQLQGKNRPETKVFYSTSEQIGRLIESLSQGADAGSFNFLPNLPSDRSGHSKTSSLSTNDINWTVEERLERMLGAM